MSDNKILLPLTDLSKIQYTDEKTGDILIRYMKGHPRPYRFDASKGFFNIKDGELLTKAGDFFTLIPIAYQVFTDEILGDQYGKMRWIELIFLNQKLQVCSMFLHGYSVDNLLDKAVPLFYDNASLCEVKLKIKPLQKVSKNPEAKGAKYWMCFFSYSLIEKEEFTALQTATKGLNLYREDTYTVNREIELTKNYGIPKKIKEELAVKAAEAKLLAETEAAEAKKAEAAKLLLVAAEAKLLAKAVAAVEKKAAAAKKTVKKKVAKAA